MKCDECGTENLEGSTFCKKCGKSFLEENSPTKVKEEIETNTHNDPNVYCECGQVLKKEWNYCPSCKKPITEEVKKAITNKKSSEESEDSNDNGLIFIILYLISIASSIFLGFSWGFPIGIIIIIAGMIRNPNNKLIRAFFIISIILFILYIIFAIWLVMTCIDTFRSCPG